MDAHRPPHRPPTPTMPPRRASPLRVALAVALLPWPWGSCFAGTALPASDARLPSKRRGPFAPENMFGSGAEAIPSSRASASSSYKGRSIPISGTPFQGVRRVVPTDGAGDGARPPSQLESVVGNAKSIAAGLGRRMDLADPTRRSQYLTAVTAGLAVSLAMVPEAVSFSFVAGVSPLVGLWTTVVLGFFAALFGGRAGICSSASGACTVVVAALCASRESAVSIRRFFERGFFCTSRSMGTLSRGRFTRLRFPFRSCQTGAVTWRGAPPSQAYCR